MVTLLIGAWSVLVAGAVLRVRPRRLRQLHDHGRLARRIRGEDVRPLAERLGRRLTPVGRPLAPLRCSQMGLALPAVVVGLFVWPPLALPAALLGWALPLRRHRRSVRTARTALMRELPDVIDLFRLAFGANLNQRLAVEAVARSTRGRIVDRLQIALDSADDGQRLHIALSDAASVLGDAARPLFGVLATDGISPADAQSQLAVIGIDARFERRRLAEIEARRVPVRLLFPLVVCVLPAFGLLTVVPIIVGSFRAFAA